MTSPQAAPRVERSVELDARPDEVWPSLIDPDQLEGWLGDQVEIDMQPGGCGHVVDDDGVRREVLVTAVEPGRRVAWHWWADGGELSSVEISLVPLPTGTRVDVVELATGPGPGPGPMAPRACAVTAVSRLAGAVTRLRVPA
jgi:uncharacterized protein YndB with AHSA1/START domain